MEKGEEENSFIICYELNFYMYFENKLNERSNIYKI